MDFGGKSAVPIFNKLSEEIQFHCFREHHNTSILVVMQKTLQPPLATDAICPRWAVPDHKNPHCTPSALKKLIHEFRERQMRVQSRKVPPSPTISIILVLLQSIPLSPSLWNPFRPLRLLQMKSFPLRSLISFHVSTLSKGSFLHLH